MLKKMDIQALLFIMPKKLLLTELKLNTTLPIQMAQQITVDLFVAHKTARPPHQLTLYKS
jgi:hypothetical protein